MVRGDREYRDVQIGDEVHRYFRAIRNDLNPYYVRVPVFWRGTVERQTFMYDGILNKQEWGVYPDGSVDNIVGKPALKGPSPCRLVVGMPEQVDSLSAFTTIRAVAGAFGIDLDLE